MADPNQVILNGPQVDTAVLRAWLDAHAPAQSAAIRDEIACAFTAYGRLSKIGNLLPFAQAIHETGNFSSARWVQAFNPAGLGATNDGAWGSTFASPSEGIVAQFGHLLAYAAKDSQLNVPQRLMVQFDPRLDPLTKRQWRGIAPRWIDLNGRWAYPGDGYGQKILQIGDQIVQAFKH
jgi:hypothetical protein